MADGKADAVDGAELLRFDRRLAREQLCQHRGRALARIFFYELVDEEKGLGGGVAAGVLLPLPACGVETSGVRSWRVGVRGGLSEHGAGRGRCARAAPPTP